MILVIASIVLWYASGIAGFIYWWTRDWSLTTGDLLFSLLIGLMGPLSWIVGWMIHGRHKILIEKKSKS